MIKISCILLPVDFSERCLGMTHYARALAEKYAAELILLHVINPVFVTPELGGAPPATVAVPQWLITEKNKALEEFALAELAGLPVRRLVYEGIPEMQILEVAKSEEVQLVVMPTHGYGVVRRFLIGSVTAKVLDDLPLAVLTGVHMEKHAHDTKEEFAVVACAIDLKADSSQTLLSAAKLASDFAAKLAVIHVAPSNSGGLQSRMEEFVTAELAKSNLSFAPGRIVSAVEGGDIAEIICGFAERVRADLLVIGRDHAEETGGKAAGRLRSHTYAIIRQASCPVLSL